MYFNLRSQLDRKCSPLLSTPLSSILVDEKDATEDIIEIAFIRGTVCAVNYYSGIHDYCTFC